MSRELNRLFTKVQVPKMLERKDNVAWDMMFPFAAEIFDFVTGHIDDTSMAKDHTISSSLVRLLSDFRWNEGLSCPWYTELENKYDSLNNW